SVPFDHSGIFPGGAHDNSSMGFGEAYFEIFSCAIRWLGLSKAGALLRASAPTLGLSAPSVSLTNRSGGNEHSPAQGASSADLRLWCGQRCLECANSLVVTGGGVGGIACRPHS